jgi:hypothetical protein
MPPSLTHASEMLLLGRAAIRFAAPFLSETPALGREGRLDRKGVFLAYRQSYF